MTYQQRLFRGFSIFLCFLIAAFSVNGFAAEKPMSRLAESGIVMKVTPKSDKIVAYTSPERSATAFPLEVLAPYFVIEEESDFYRVTDVAARTVAEAEAGKVGFVAKNDIYVWPTRKHWNSRRY